MYDFNHCESFANVGRFGMSIKPSAGHLLCNIYFELYLILFSKWNEAEWKLLTLYFP